MISLDLAVNAIVAGLLLGGFYAAVTVGVTISFGMLDIVNIAHPAFIMLGSFVAYIVNSNFGVDPILIGVVMTPVFFLVGMAVYQIYYYAFERRGEESVTFSWLAEKLTEFVDLHPEHEAAVERLATWLARGDDDED